MSLGYILERLESNSGISNPELNPAQRAYILQVINEACDEIYSTTDLPVILKEVDIQVTKDLRMALPGFVGEIRAVRVLKNWDWANYKFSLMGIQSKFAGNNWANKWSNFEIIGESPIANELLTQLPLKFSYPVIDPTLIISTVGESSNSNRVVDNTPMAGLTVYGSKNYINITSLKKNRLSDYNVTITDANDNELAVIYADQLDSRYLLVDISKYPDLAGTDCCVGDTPYGYMATVLYKPRLNLLVNDEDEFPVTGFDDIIVIRAKQLLAEDTDGALAVALYQKSQKRLKGKIQDKTGTFKAKLTTAPNPIYKFKSYFYGPSMRRRFL